MSVKVNKERKRKQNVAKEHKKTPRKNCNARFQTWFETTRFGNSQGSETGNPGKLTLPRPLSPPNAPCKSPPFVWECIGVCLTDHVSKGRQWGVGSVVVESAFLGHPDFQCRGPKTLILKDFGAIWGKHLGCPKRRSNDHGSNSSFSAL